ncbi:MAG: DUF1588 domain-containing protein, partial [Myxococcota bacterium]
WTRSWESASNFSITENELDALFTLSDEVAVLALGDNKLPRCIREAHRDSIHPSTECQSSTVTWVGEKAFRRPLVEAEVLRLTERFTLLLDDLGPRLGIEAGIAAIMTTPEFLFRYEVGEGEPDAFGRRRLNPYEVATAIAYTLFDRRPDGGLLAAAAEDNLQTAEAIEAQIDRMLQNEQPCERDNGCGVEGAGRCIEGRCVSVGISTTNTRRFFRQYFHYDRADDIFKDPPPDELPDHNPGQQIAQLGALIHDVLREDRDVLARLLTSRRHLESPPQQFKELVALPRDAWSELPEQQRSGVLTREAWLVAHSTNFENDPIHRGHFIRESLLCGVVPDLPIGFVPQLPPQTEDQTLRDVLAIHTENAECRACHDLMDPLGLPFEQYDHYGNYRTEEAGRPVEVDGAIFGDMEVAGPVDGPIALSARLAQSAHVKRCFIRHTFRFVLGRNETSQDACTLATAEEAYDQSGGSLKALMVALLSSESQLMRTLGPEEENP